MDAAAAADLPPGRGGAGAGVCGARVRRVRDQVDPAQSQADRGQRSPCLLHGQFGVLRSGHLRPVPGAGDDHASPCCCSTSATSREQVGATAVLAILWGGLVLTLSRSSLGALLVGLGMLAALRWNAWRAVVVGAVVVAIGAAALAVSPNTFGLNQGLNGASSGRANLVTGGSACSATGRFGATGRGRSSRLTVPTIPAARRPCRHRTPSR